MLLPSFVLNAPANVAGYVRNRRRGLSYIAGTVGGIYLVGKYAIRKMGEMAELARRDALERENLEKRFSMNLQDCQFTVLALLPTLSQQIFEDMDVESLSGQLAVAAARLRAEECAKLEREETELKQREDFMRLMEMERERLARGETEEDPPEEGLEGGDDLVVPVVEDVAPPSPALNPSASVFVPSFGPKSPTIPSVAPPIVEEQPNSSPISAPEEPSAVEAPPAAVASPSYASVVTRALPPTLIDDSVSSLLDLSNNAAAAVQGSASDHVLTKSWAQIVVDGDGVAKEVEDAVTEPAVPERTRAEIWNDIKIISFTRTITSLYILTLLTLQTHIQLNLLGRSTYVSSVVSSVGTGISADPTSTIQVENDDETDLENGTKEQKIVRTGEISKETERMYLTFSWWLLHEGWKEVAARVKVAVEEVVGPMALKSTIAYGDLSGILSEIRAKVDLVDDGTHYDFSPALFPTTPSAEFLTLSSGGLPPSSYSSGIPAPLRQLLNETSDFLDCADCSLVRKTCLDKLFSKLVDGCEGAFKTPGGGPEDGSRFEDVTERTTRLASLLPSIARQTHLVLNGMPNEYVETLEDVRELSEFSAIIYASFDKTDLQ